MRAWYPGFRFAHPGYLLKVRRATSGDSARVTSLRRLIEGLGVGAERFARLRVGIEHMPTAIEEELRARRVAARRQSVEHVAARGRPADPGAVSAREGPAERQDRR